MSMDFFLIRKSVSLRVLSKKMNPFNYQFPRQAAVKCAGCLGQKKKRWWKARRSFFLFLALDSTLSPERENCIREVLRSQVCLGHHRFGCLHVVKMRSPFSDVSTNFPFKGQKRGSQVIRFLSFPTKYHYILLFVTEPDKKSNFSPRSASFLPMPGSAVHI